VPQQIVQISPRTAGHARRARRWPQILHKIVSAIRYPVLSAKLVNSPTDIIGSEPMQRVDLFIKVEVELDEDEKPERVAREICRQIEKIYVVRSAELSNAVVRE
jgi:hypothetical protein